MHKKPQVQNLRFIFGGSAGQLPGRREYEAKKNDPSGIAVAFFIINLKEGIISYESWNTEFII